MNVQNAYIRQEEMTPDTESVKGDAGEDGFNITDFLRILRTRRSILLGTALIVFALATIAVLMMTPQYSATAVVMLDQRKNNVEDTGAVLSGLPTDSAAVQNQVQILTSRELIGRVVDRLHLVDDPEFNPKPSMAAMVLGTLNPMHWFSAGQIQVDAQGEDPRRNQAIQTVLGKLRVSPIGLSTAINVSFSSPSAVKSAYITNAVADAYVDDQLEAKFEATRKATDWLRERIKDLSFQTQAADAAVQQFKVEHGITMDARGNSVVDQQISDLNSRIIFAKTELAEKQANYQRLAALAKSGDAASAPQVIASPLISTLRAQESELTRNIADMASKYGPRHPKMLDMQAQKANLDSKINEEILRIVQSVQSDAEASQVRVSSLLSSLHQLEQQNAGEDKDSVKLKSLESTAASARAMYEAFLGRLNQTQDQQGIQTPDARIITRAEIPQGVSFPKKQLILPMSLVAGLLLGLGLAFIADRLDAGFRTAEQAEAALHLPVLGAVPEVHVPTDRPEPAVPLKAWLVRLRRAFSGHIAPERHEDPQSDQFVTQYALDKPMSSYAEALRGVQLGLTLSEVDTPPKLIMLTSSVAGEGKTTLAISLARVMAHGGLKVVLVDCDLRRPALHKRCGVVPASLGLTEVLAEKRRACDYLVKDATSEVMLLPVRAAAAHPMKILSSQAFHDMLEELKQGFDMVLLDSSPLLPVNDSRVLSSLVDAVLFAVLWEKTPREVAAQAVRILRDARAPLAGTVLTRADLREFHYYNYGYKYGYKNYSNYNRYYTD